MDIICLSMLCCIYGFILGLVICSLSNVPYHFTTQMTGVRVLSAFIGSFLGICIPSPMADWLVRYMSNKNSGVYEAGYRNLLCTPAFILGFIYSGDLGYLFKQNLIGWDVCSFTVLQHLLGLSCHSYLMLTFCIAIERSLSMDMQLSPWERASFPLA